MKNILLFLGFFIFQQSLLATTGCNGICKGSSKTILDTLGSGANSGQLSDFKFNCKENLGGYVTTHSPVYCGSYYVCEKSESSSYTVAGTGSTTLEARQAVRKSCTAQNNNVNGHGCEVSWRYYELVENSLKCSID